MASLCISSTDAALYSPEDRFEISVQQIMSCNSDQVGCEGGWASSGADALSHGIVKERDATYLCGGGDPLNHFYEDAGGSCEHYPWGSTCQASSLAVPNWNIDGASRVIGEADMMALIALGNALYVRFDVYDSFWSLGVGSIYRGPAGSVSGGHAVTAVGYGVEQGVKYWNLQNSWGVDYQVNGFFKYERGINLGGIEEGAVVLNVWVTDGREVVCSDTDAGATDLYGDGCGAYSDNIDWCGKYDDSDFHSTDQCCGCGGGAYTVENDYTPAPLVVTPGPCSDTSGSATDPYGDTCADYAANPGWCGKYDDNDFQSSSMCCGCGGGYRR